jgi:hypothetical protein
MVLPDYNAFAYRTSLGVDRFEARVLPLDPAQPSGVPWLAGACGLDRVADGRAAVSRGVTCSNAETQQLLELRDARDGRVLVSAQGAYVSASSLVVSGDRLIDPQSGEEMPDVPGWVVGATGGRAITRLGDGGAALLRLDAAPAPQVSSPIVVAQATCTWPDFAHVAIAKAANIGCQDLKSAADAHRLVLSPGRQPTASSLTLNSLEVDARRRLITIRYVQNVTSRWAGPTAQAAVVGVPEKVTGDWLVWLVPDGEASGYSNGVVFGIRLP